MSSRKTILSSLNTPREKPDPSKAYPTFDGTLPENNLTRFKDTLISIGGSVITITDTEKLNEYIATTFPLAKNIVSGLGELQPRPVSAGDTPHVLKDVEVAILAAEFGIAENGAIWITDRTMLDRALPFICENLILVIPQDSIFHSLHQAYEKIQSSNYNFGTFIAGPSKTADIEQSLVLGAHGPKTLCVCILQRDK